MLKACQDFPILQNSNTPLIRNYPINGVLFYKANIIVIYIFSFSTNNKNNRYNNTDNQNRTTNSYTIEHWLISIENNEIIR